MTTMNTICINHIHYTLYNYNYICAFQFEINLRNQFAVFFSKRLNISTIN